MDLSNPISCTGYWRFLRLRERRGLLYTAPMMPCFSPSSPCWPSTLYYQVLSAAGRFPGEVTSGGSPASLRGPRNSENLPGVFGQPGISIPCPPPEWQQSEGGLGTWADCFPLITGSFRSWSLLGAVWEAGSVPTVQHCRRLPRKPRGERRSVCLK